jgi:hypothetical protein
MSFPRDIVAMDKLSSRRIETSCLFSARGGDPPYLVSMIEGHARWFGVECEVQKTGQLGGEYGS